MKLYRFQTNDGVVFAAGEGSELRRLPGTSVADLDMRAGGELFDREGATLLAPVAPGKIVAVGRNYADHAKELGNEPPKEPIIFLKPPSAVIAPGAHIVRPAASERVDFEGELAIVIGRRARHVPAASWRDYVLGFTCAIDVTARDLQKKDVQFTRGKSFDTFCPLGPWIETELDPANLMLTTRVNGEVRQHESTDKMIFPCAAVVEFISGIMTLEPGDVILTGTPAGVGPLQAGDTIEVEIEGIGVLENKVRNE
jgi:2-keto-4-pentenoate hydratase/2-oxohepta-3-ene-1,7-dioic acid hydratase in catechol pathway